MAKTTKLRFWIAMAAAKAARAAIQAAGRNGSHTPGAIALKICPDFLRHLTKPETVICVTGTNGKTTASNMLSSILTDCGYDVTSNSTGSNIQAGIATALLADATMNGKPKKKMAVLEVDERSSILVYRYLKPDYLLVNNLMRDSLKRNAHTEFITYVLNQAIPAETHLVLNADDLITARIAPQSTVRTYFGISAEKPENGAAGPERELVYCPECGAPMHAEYVRYQHIGRLFCPDCGLKSPEPDFAVSAIDRKGGSFTVSHGGQSTDFRLVNDNIVNVYNFCGVIAMLSTLGIPDERLHEAFKHVKVVQSRFDVIYCGDITITMQLAKGENPSACAQAYRYVADNPEKGKCLVVINDDKFDNTEKESESTCWLYDCDESALKDDSIEKIIFVGKRRWDQRERAILAGVDPNKILTAPAPAEGADLVDIDTYRSIYVLYDNYLVDQAMIVQKRLAAKAENIGRNHSMTVEVLYNEVCNLYGDAQNAVYLQQTLPSARFIYTSMKETPYFVEHRPDIVLMGAMSESTQRRVIEELMPYKARIEELIDDNVVFLMTGNACEVFTKEIEYVTEKMTVPALGIFDLIVRTDWFKRYNGKVLGTFGNLTITGFRSQFGMIHGNNKKFPFLKVKRGIGINPKSNLEGMHRNNFFGTQLLGPILPTNPLFTEYLIRQAGGEASAAAREAAMAAYEQRIREFSDVKVKFK